MQSNPYLIPGAIVIAAALISVGLFFGEQPSLGQTNDEDKQETFENGNSKSAEALREVDAQDHIRGPKDAAITIVEYSDYQCPFCGMVHPTLQKILEENKDVRWVYRHFPLTSIHPQALRASVAGECVAELEGEEAFWNFTDAIFAGAKLDDASLTKLAGQNGVTANAFSTCLDAGNHEERIRADFENAIAVGAQGTPFVVVVNEQGEKFPFAGALPKAQIDAIIKQARGSNQ